MIFSQFWTVHKVFFSELLNKYSLYNIKSTQSKKAFYFDKRRNWIANLFEISTCYAFLDGNKQAAFTCMTIFLALNGIDINFDVDKTFDMMVNIAIKKVSFGDVVDWLHSFL